MSQQLIDIDLFIDGIELWPNLVFKKDFDAYFLLDYPAYQYNLNEENIFEPFAFLNNLQEITIYISDPSGKNNLTHTINADWNLKLYYNAYQQKIKEERFLFWESDSQNWAMVSDAKYKVAVIGIDWQIANQVQLFFSTCLLSPKQFIEKTNIQKHEKIFLQNYQPAKVLVEGNAENPIWHKYFFQCYVKNENDKLYYWPQFEKMFSAIHPILKHCKGIDMYASQAFQRRYWMNKQWYSSYKNAPVGGWQNYNHKNCHKVANKFLNNNDHLRLLFEGKQNESDALYIANKNGLIEFFDFWIYANLIKQKQKEGNSDFYFQATRNINSTKSDNYNQLFNVCYLKSLLHEVSVNKLVKELSVIGFAIRVHKLVMPNTYAIFTLDKPLEINEMYSATINFESDDYLIM